MKKPIYSKDEMRQIISSGWKLFNRQTNCISTGNVAANTQYSSFIRPWKETECNGRVNPEGHLMEFDLKAFKGFHIPKKIKDVLTDRNREGSVILYMFFVTVKDTVCPFGWVITTYDDRFICDQAVCHYGEHLSKRRAALEEAKKYIIKD